MQLERIDPRKLAVFEFTGEPPAVGDTITAIIPGHGVRWTVLDVSVEDGSALIERLK